MFSNLVVKLTLLSHISQWNLVCSFIQSYEFLIRIQDLFSNLDSRRQIESFVTYLTWEFCLLFHSKLSVFDKNSRLVFKSRCQIESFFTHLTMESCLLLHSKLWIFDKHSSLLFKSRDVKLNLLSHISKWNFVCFFIQS